MIAGVQKVAMVTVASDWLNYKEAFSNSVDAANYLSL